MEDYYEYLDSNGVTTLYKLIKDDTVALIDSYSVTINGITTNLDSHVNDTDIHTPIATIEGMIDTKVSGLVNSAPETLDTLKELSDALGNDPNFATTVANQIGNKASKDDVYTKEETDTLLEGKADSVHNHVVKDITDFPTIPTKTSELSNDSNFVTSTELHDYATKNDLNSKQDALSEEQLSNIDSIPDKANKSDLSTVATSGSYKDLLDKPVLPEGADLSDYYNKGETDNLLNSKANTSDLAVVAKSGNYNDLNNTPTIPTKLSQLENDMGFGSGSDGVITSISWTNITDKPNFATVATSGSYTDLSNTPTIPTKVSQLENDTGFINALTDVVDTKSNQTINGTKTFTVAPIVSNNATTNGYAVKLNAIARNDVPSQLYHATFRAYDKNTQILGEYCVEKSTTGDALLNMNVRSEDASGNQIAHGLQFRMTNDGSVVRFIPSANNKVHLGDVNAKWAKIYSDDVVHTSGNEIINGSKTFTNQMYLGSGGTGYGLISAKDTNSILRLFGGTAPSNGANLDLYGEGLSDGGFSLRARTSEKIVALDGKIDGTLKWNGKNVALDENLVHRSGDETINGSKSFTSEISRMNNAVDRTTTPSQNLYSAFTFLDKARLSVGSIQHCQRTSGINDISFYVTGNSNVSYGVCIRSNKEFSPIENNTYSLGSASNKWAKVYSDDVVHTSGNEYINGTKMFSNTIHRYADLTTSGGEQVYRFDDTNANPCGHIYNNTHWTGDAIFNRHGAYNAKSGKSMELDIISTDSGVGMAYVAGTATKGNLETVTSETGHTAIATMGWVNNPATSTNVVHRSGDETIAGNKTFSNRVSFPSGYFIFTDTNDNSLRISRSGSGHGNNYKVIIQGDTGKFFAPNGFIGNLQGNADTATSANSATYATTQATTDNSTKIATTAWVRTYVNSVVGSNTVGSSVSAYWSNSSNVTATGQASAHSSSSTIYPACYSDYINKTPTVGTIYSGAQLYTEYGTSASATGTLQSQGQYVTRITTTKAQVTFRSPISATGKYLCTTANTVKFRAYTAQGSTSTVGASSIVDYTITKSIFIRVE